MTTVTTIDAYVAAVRTGLTGLRASDRDEALAELESLLRADAERAGESAAVAALGDPGAYAAGVLEALGSAPRSESEAGPQPQGRLLGMPYDFRGASVDRIGNRLWNTEDPRIFMPRLFGLGWTINFGAIAVKLHLIRPDDTGDESFDRIPAATIGVLLAVPAALALGAVVLVALAWAQLPAEVPFHWGVSGAPDDWAPKALALGLLLAIGVVPIVMTYARILRPGVPARSRVLSSVALALPAVLSLGLVVMTIADADGGSSGNWAGFIVLVALIIPFFMLYIPMRLGLHAEWRESRVRDQRRS